MGEILGVKVTGNKEGAMKRITSSIKSGRRARLNPKPN